MKKAILIMLAILAAQTATVAHAGTTSYTVVLAGGAEQSMIRIWLTPDGRSYVIDSIAPLEVGGAICENTTGNPDELVCQAPVVAGFEVNAGIGADTITVAKDVLVPVTLRGGGGPDTLIGGGGPDKLVGGEGNDILSGRAGDDLIYGGPGNDALFGGTGNDVLRGGTGQDAIGGGTGENSIRQSLRKAF